MSISILWTFPKGFIVTKLQTSKVFKATFFAIVVFAGLLLLCLIVKAWISTGSATAVQRLSLLPAASTTDGQYKVADTVRGRHRTHRDTQERFVNG